MTEDKLDKGPQEEHQAKAHQAKVHLEDHLLAIQITEGHLQAAWEDQADQADNQECLLQVKATHQAILCIVHQAKALQEDHKEAHPQIEVHQVPILSVKAHDDDILFSL